MAAIWARLGKSIATLKPRRGERLRYQRVGQALSRLHDELVVAVTAALYNGDFSALEQPGAERVLEALRRSTASLSDGASAGEIARYLQQYDEEQLFHHIGNVRGIYHELRFADEVVAENPDVVSAELFEHTNHPGADVRLFYADGSHEDVQLKATDSGAYIAEHLERYPDIELYATEEVLGRIEDARLHSSGLSNDELQQEVEQVYADLESGLEQPIQGTPLAVVLVGVRQLWPVAAAYRRGELTLREAANRLARDSRWPVARAVALLSLLSTESGTPFALGFLLARALWVFSATWGRDVLTALVQRARQPETEPSA